MSLHDSGNDNISQALQDFISKVYAEFLDLRNEKGVEPPAGCNPIFEVGEEVMIRGETRSDCDTNSATVIHRFYADANTMESHNSGWYYLTDHQPVYHLAWRESSLRKKPVQASKPNTVADCKIVERVKTKAP